MAKRRAKKRKLKKSVKILLFLAIILVGAGIYFQMISSFKPKEKKEPKKEEIVEEKETKKE